MEGGGEGGGGGGNEAVIASLAVATAADNQECLLLEKARCEAPHVNLISNRLRSTDA